MTLPVTINEPLKRLSSLPVLLMQNHSGGDSVALGIVSLFPPPTGISVPASTCSETTRRKTSLTNQPTNLLRLYMQTPSYTTFCFVPGHFGVDHLLGDEVRRQHPEGVRLRHLHHPHFIHLLHLPQRSATVQVSSSADCRWECGGDEGSEWSSR